MRDVLPLLDAEKIEKLSGEKVFVYETVSSTNTEARNLLSNVPGNFAVLSEEQTKGRGRLDRTFYSEKHSGLYMSAVVRTTLPPDKLSLVTPFAALAVSKSIDKITGTETGIKWVNDIYLGGKKLSGILTESILMPDSKTVIVGIGINVSERSFPPDISGFATSLYLETGRDANRNLLAAEILKSLSGMDEAVRRGDFVDGYRDRSVVIGKTVTAGGEKYNITDIDKECRLVAEKDGKTFSFAPDEISLHGGFDAKNA